MEWSFDQWVKVLTAAGGWMAAVGTIAAVSVALLLARRSEKVRLKTSVDCRLVIAGDGSQPTRCLMMSVTNVGQRPVTIMSTGWRIGRWKSKRFCIHLPSTTSPSKFGAKIEHGETAHFMTDFEESPNWMSKFAGDFVKDSSLKTLRTQIHTSVGHTKDILITYEAHVGGTPQPFRGDLASRPAFGSAFEPVQQSLSVPTGRFSRRRADRMRIVRNQERHCA